MRVSTQGIVAVAGLSVADSAADDSTRRERLAAAIDRTSKTWVRPAQSYEPDSARHEEYAFFYRQYGLRPNQSPTLVGAHTC